jgi:hypothetical protein
MNVLFFGWKNCSQFGDENLSEKFSVETEFCKIDPGGRFYGTVTAGIFYHHFIKPTPDFMTAAF